MLRYTFTPLGAGISGLDHDDGSTHYLTHADFLELKNRGSWKSIAGTAKGRTMPAFGLEILRQRKSDATEFLAARLNRVRSSSDHFEMIVCKRGGELLHALALAMQPVIDTWLGLHALAGRPTEEYASALLESADRTCSRALCALQTGNRELFVHAIDDFCTDAQAALEGLFSEDGHHGAKV